MSDQTQLLRGLMRMQVAEPHAYDLLVGLLKGKQQEMNERLIVADDTLRFHRLQGGIKSVKDLLEFIEKPNELMTSIEKNLS